MTIAFVVHGTFITKSQAGYSDFTTCLFTMSSTIYRRHAPEVQNAHDSIGGAYNVPQEGSWRNIGVKRMTSTICVVAQEVPARGEMHAV